MKSFFFVRSFENQVIAGAIECRTKLIFKNSHKGKERVRLTSILLHFS